MSCCGLILHIGENSVNIADFKNCRNINGYVKTHFDELYQDVYKATFKDLLIMRSAMQKMFYLINNLVGDISKNNGEFNNSLFNEAIKIASHEILNEYYENKYFSPLVEGNLDANSFIKLYNILCVLEDIIVYNIAYSKIEDCYVEWWVD